MFQIVAIVPHEVADKMRRHTSAWWPGRCNAYTVTLHLSGFATDDDAMRAAEGLRRDFVWAIEKHD